MKTNIKLMKKLVAVAFVLGTTSVAGAGKGGSNLLIQQAIQSGSQDGILAEIERTETLECSECVATVKSLLTDDRYPVREAAAWWFAKRPGLQRQIAAAMETDIASGDSIRVRNAADFLGTTKEYKALPLLRTAMASGSSLSSDAKIALIRGARMMSHVNGNPILLTGMGDADPLVRVAAIDAWRDILGQTSVAPVEQKLGDADARVRAAAATVLGAYRDAGALGQLAQLVTNDPEPHVRRNAAWALGKIGSDDARAALTAASQDATPIVASVAKAALASLR